MFFLASELAENRKVVIKSTRPKHRTHGVMSLGRTSPRRSDNHVNPLINSVTGAAMNSSLDPNLEMSNLRQRFSDTSDRIDSYTSSTNYTASLREEIRKSKR